MEAPLLELRVMEDFDAVADRVQRHADYVAFVVDVFGLAFDGPAGGFDGGDGGVEVGEVEDQVGGGVFRFVGGVFRDHDRGVFIGLGGVDGGAEVQDDLRALR